METKQSPPGTSSTPDSQHWYTPQHLVDLAQKAGVEITTRQIEEWQKDGLLPKPVRTRLPGQGRGRAPYQYPDPAPQAAIWLGSYRRVIHGVSAARFWMWLEGFDYIGVDQSEVILSRLQERWAEVQDTIPSLPGLASLASEGLSEELQVKVLDELDANGTQSQLDSGEWDERTVARATLGASALGIYPPERLNQQEAGDEEPYFDLLYPEVPEQHHDAMQNALPTMVEIGQLVNLYRGLIQHQFNWTVLRDSWSTSTFDMLRQIWPLAQQLSPFHLTKKPENPGDLLSFFDYDPLNLFQFMAMIAGAVNAFPQTPAATSDTTDESSGKGENTTS